MAAWDEPDWEELAVLDAILAERRAAETTKPRRLKAADLADILRASEKAKAAGWTVTA